MNYTQRFVAGVFSLGMLALLIIGPGYLSEKLEEIETSQSGLVSREEVHRSAETTYQPYRELNEDTILPQANPNDEDLDSIYVQANVWYDMDDTTIFNVDGYRDQLSIPTPTFSVGADLYLFMEISPQQLLVDGIYNLGLYFDSNTEQVRLRDIYWWGQDINHDTSTNSHWDESYYPVGSQTGSPGIHTWNITMDDTLLNNGISALEMDIYHGVLIVIEFTSDLNNEMFYMSVEFESDYYLEITTWDNQTIYEPYIQIITPFVVHKVSMGLGGVLILMFGWIASPFNKNFDNFIPINFFKHTDKNRR